MVPPRPARLVSSTISDIQSAEYRSALLLSAFMVAAALFVQFYWNSMFDVADDGWLFRLRLHQDYYPFSARIFTTYPVIWLGKLLGSRYELAFGLFQYSLYFILGPLLYQYLRRLKIEHLWALGGLVIFYLSYPMIAAFHEPVSTWDDFLQYGALIMAFSFLIAGRLSASTIAFSFGVAAREATILIYPVWALAIWMKSEKPAMYRLRFMLLPLLVGAALWYFPEKEPAAKGIHSIQENFRDAKWTRNSLYSLFMGLGFLWVMIPLALFSKRVTETLKGTRRFVWLGSLYAPPAVTLVVLFAAYARETRLFFPPFVFVIPLVLVFLHKYRESYIRYFSRGHYTSAVLTIGLALWLGRELSLWLFPHFDYRSALLFAQGIFGGHVAVAIVAALPLIVERIWRKVRIERTDSALPPRRS